MPHPSWVSSISAGKACSTRRCASLQRPSSVRIFWNFTNRSYARRTDDNVRQDGCFDVLRGLSRRASATPIHDPLHDIADGPDDVLDRRFQFAARSFRQFGRPSFAPFGVLLIAFASRVLDWVFTPLHPSVIASCCSATLVVRLNSMEYAARFRRRSAPPPMASLCEATGDAAHEQSRTVVDGAVVQVFEQYSNALPTVGVQRRPAVDAF